MAQQYADAGEILEKLKAGQGSFKNLLYGTKRSVPIPALYALVTETLKYQTVIEDIIQRTNLFTKNKFLTAHGRMIHVMIYDLLLGKNKTVKGGGKVKKLLVSYKNQFEGELVKLKLRHKVQTVEELIPKHLRMNFVIPRYVRVNLLKSTMKEAVEKFVAIGFTQVQVADVADKLEDPKLDKASWGKIFWKDPHLSDMLVFPPSTDLHDNELLLSGKIILQDKASALSGAALEPPAEDSTFCLDACSAPGQKTSQLAQSMENKGTLLAIEQDRTRFKLLTTRTKANGITNIQPKNMSFLDINVNEEPFKNVEYILLDPSCSGSGIVNRLDFNDEVDQDKTGGDSLKDRLEKLSAFQLSMIEKAFSFPKVKRVVYSTCSIHDEENELVVKKALELGSAFHLVRVLPQFPSRGKNIIPNGDYCVRTTPEVDHTIGFFVSRFERNSEAINVDTKAANTNPKKRKTPEPVEKPLKTNEVAPRPPRESTTGTNAPNETTTHKKQKTQEDSASVETPKSIVAEPPKPAQKVSPTEKAPKEKKLFQNPLPTVTGPLSKKKRKQNRSNPRPIL